MGTAAITDPVTAVRANARLQREAAQPLRLWPSLLAAWTRRLDQRIDDNLRWLDHDGVREDFRRAKRG